MKYKLFYTYNIRPRRRSETDVTSGNTQTKPIKLHGVTSQKT